MARMSPLVRTVAHAVVAREEDVRVLEIRQRGSDAAASGIRLFALPENASSMRPLGDVDPYAPLDLMHSEAAMLPAPASAEFARAVGEAYAGCNAGWHRNVSDGRDVTVAPSYLRGKESALYVAFEPPSERSPAASRLAANIGALVFVHATRDPARTLGPATTEEVNWVCKPSPSSTVRMHRLLTAILTTRLQENPHLRRFRLDAVGSERARPLYERIGFVALPGGDDDEMVLERDALPEGRRPSGNKSVMPQ